MLVILSVHCSCRVCCCCCVCCALLSVMWRNSLQDQQTREGQGDPDPPQCDLGFAEDQLTQESLQGWRKVLVDLKTLELK